MLCSVTVEAEQVMVGVGGFFSDPAVQKSHVKNSACSCRSCTHFKGDLVYLTSVALGLTAKIQAWAQAFSLCYPTWEHLNLVPHSSFLPVQCLGGDSDGSSNWVSTTPRGRPEFSFHHTVAAQPLKAFGGMHQQPGAHLCFLSKFNYNN